MTAGAGPGDVEVKRIGARMLVRRDDILIRSWSNEERIQKTELAGYRASTIRGGVSFRLIYKDTQRFRRHRRGQHTVRACSA